MGEKYVNNTLKVDNLYLDCNSIIYDAYSKIEFDKLTEPIAIRIINSVIRKIEDYVNIINPSQTLIIAFDGVTQDENGILNSTGSVVLLRFAK